MACPTQAIGSKVCQTKVLLVNPIYTIYARKNRYFRSLASIDGLIGTTGTNDSILDSKDVGIATAACPSIEVEVSSGRPMVGLEITESEWRVGPANFGWVLHFDEVRTFARANNSSFSIGFYQNS